MSFALEAEDFCAVIGPSGAGKSTLIRCINRLVEPSGGEIILFGEDVLSVGHAGLRRLRRRIGMIFQEFNLVNRLSSWTTCYTAGSATLGPCGACSGPFRGRT